jgi:hypothetical protein
MNTSRADQLQDKVFGVCMILAPILLLVSSVAFNLVGDTLGGGVLVYASFVFIPAVLGLTGLLWERVPRLAVALRLLAIFGCVGGACFGAVEAFVGAVAQTGASEATVADLVALYNSGLLFLDPLGLSFPLSMIALGITLWRTGTVPAWAGIVLVLAGVAFPIGRVSTIYALYPVADVLFIVSMGWIGLRSYLSPGTSATGARVT